MRKKTIIVVVVVLVVLLIISLSNTYTSSPGFTTQEHAKKFYENKPICYGKSILLNEEATWADAPGRSVCIWFLKKK